MLRSSLPSVGGPAGQQQTRSQRAPAARPRSKAANSGIRAPPAAVLERTQTSPHAEVLVDAPEWDLLQGGAFDAGFHEYASATCKMEDLEKLSAELLANLQELNSAADALGAMPTPSFEEQQDDQEARRAKRAAARARRASSSTAAPPQQPSAAVQQQQQRPAAASISKQTYEQPAKEEWQRLEELLKLNAPALTTASASVAAPKRALPAAPAQAQPTPSTSIPAVAEPAASPVALRLGHASTSASMGPSLLSLAPRTASTGLQAEPSARAREANARRARLSSRRASTASSATAVDNVKLSHRSTTSSDGTTQFMKKAASLDLLNGISEKELTAIVKDLLFLQNVQRDLKGILRRDPTMDEWAKAVSMDVRTFSARVAAGQSAKAMMLQANYRLVISVCKKYQNRGIALQDLITEGVQGLLKGVEKFDADKGFRFSTYAHWWIRQAVTRSLSDQGRTVRLPAHMYELLVRIQVAKQRLQEESGHEPSLEQIAARTQMTVERIKEVTAMARPSNSLDMPVGEDDGMSSMKDMLEDERSTPDEVLDEVMLRKDLAAILCELNEREAGVIRLRFGLEGEQEMTLEDIGIHFKVTRERIRQIEAKAVRKLKQKQRELQGILHEYSSSTAEVELAGRKSQGTNKKG